jgi:hypothetical protein
MKGAYVDSNQVQELPIEERRLAVPEWPYPIRLRDVTDVDALRKRLTSAQKRIGRPPSDTAPGGNERRRMRLRLELTFWAGSSVGETAQPDSDQGPL